MPSRRSAAPVTMVNPYSTTPTHPPNPPLMTMGGGMGVAGVEGSHSGSNRPVNMVMAPVASPPLTMMVTGRPPSTSSGNNHNNNSSNLNLNNNNSLSTGSASHAGDTTHPFSQFTHASSHNSHTPSHNSHTPSHNSQTHPLTIHTRVLS